MLPIVVDPAYKLDLQTPAPEGYPVVRVPDPYSLNPFAPTYTQRRHAFLAHVLRNPTPLNVKAPYYELCRLDARVRREPGSKPHLGIFYAACDFIDARKDCADFSLHAILRLLYQFGEHPAIPLGLVEHAEKTVLGFKYWPDEPGRDSLCTWTENHQILYASAGYLAGQRFPKKIFTNSGETGIQKVVANRPRILHWLSVRYHTGFSEWLSNVYYDEDLTALLALVDFAADAEIRQRAALVIDLILLDMALNSFKGVFGSSHGRSYEASKKWAACEGTTDTEKLLFGMGQFSQFDSMSAPAFALSTYRLPPAIEAIARDLSAKTGPAELLNQQRQGLTVDEATTWGPGTNLVENGLIYLGMEAYLHPRTIRQTLQMFDACGWWSNSFFKPLNRFQWLLRAADWLDFLPDLARRYERDICRNTREAVNVLTYRTPDYMLSTAQDYRKGYGGDQQSIWQATLGPDAVCFTTHPSRLWGPSPNAWTGSGLLPRAAQVKNVAIILYKIEKIPALYVPTKLFYTHAWLPKDRFDEVIERDGWVFVRKGNGYLALRCSVPTRWQQAVTEDLNRELIADGPQAVWLVELGRGETDGLFKDFVAKILKAELSFGPLSVRYHSPSQGWLAFAWEGDLLQEGQPVVLGPYPRYENPYVSAEFSVQVIKVNAGGKTLRLDWRAGKREMGEPPKGEEAPA